MAGKLKEKEDAIIPTEAVEVDTPVVEKIAPKVINEKPNEVAQSGNTTRAFRQ